ncbi:hypothetical protein EVA_22630, partial [gut metagenome]
KQNLKRIRHRVAEALLYGNDTKAVLN